MPLPKAPDPEDAALQFTLRWFQLIAEERWTEALSLIDMPSSYGQTWSRALIEEQLAEYGSAGTRVTPPATATGTRHTNFGQFNDGKGFYLDCSFPLNGSWSDLSAQFEFLEANGYYSVSLQDVHVL
jgi:hypothetical protein